MSNTKVYIMIDNDNYSKKVIPAYDYQEDALNDYIDNHKVGKNEYIINNSTKFYIDNFNSVGLFGDYYDFYSFISEYNSELIISRNLDKLNGFCGFRNRLTSF